MTLNLVHRQSYCRLYGFTDFKANTRQFFELFVNVFFWEHYYMFQSLSPRLAVGWPFYQKDGEKTELW